MKINEFELNQYKGIKHLLIKNPPNTVVLIGTNGSGKSTVLKALNLAMRFCMGYDTPLESGIRIVLDLEDHLESIKKWLDLLGNFPNVLSYIRNNQKMDITISAQDISLVHKYFKNVVFPIFSKTPLIEVTSSDIKLFKSQYEGLPPDVGKGRINSTYIADFQKQSNSNSIYGHILIKWIQRRKSNMSDVPGVAFFDSERNRARSSTIQANTIPQATLQRIGNLADQNWRAENLGERLLSLITQYSRKETSSQFKFSRINPVKRINDNLQSFTPQLSIISPLLSDTRLQFKIRDVTVDLNQLSSGEISLINFAIDYLECEINRGILIIDEPSSYLHYDLQSKLVSFIEELVTTEENGEEQRPQIWLATHSPPIINSVDENSVYIIDLDSETPAQPLTNRKTTLETNQILALLGVNHYYGQRPVLYVEGKYDTYNLNTILNRFNKDLLSKWYFHKVGGVQAIDKMHNNLKELKTIAESIEAHEFLSILKQNHFLKDRDNSLSPTSDDDLFVWNFYHLENVLFQDKWFDRLKELMEYRKNEDIDIDESLEQAKKEIYKRMQPPLEEQLEELNNTEEWKNKLKGRELFIDWVHKTGITRFKPKRAIKQLMDETISIDELPSEIKRLINWLEKKHRDWNS